MPVPSFNVDGFLSPNDPSDPTSRNRSPYLCSVMDVCQFFATSIERVEILLGWLNLRSDLTTCGAGSGFQWLDGSFVQDIEAQESRPPGDIDVVSIVILPDKSGFEANLRGNFPDLIGDERKVKYRTDHFIVPLEGSMALIENLCYWFSLFSHTRENIWKGLLQVDFPSSEDSLAIQFLNERRDTLSKIKPELQS